MCRGRTVELVSQTHCFLTKCEEYPCQEESFHNVVIHSSFCNLFSGMSAYAIAVFPQRDTTCCSQQHEWKLHENSGHTWKSLLNALGPHVESSWWSVFSWLHCCCARLVWEPWQVATGYSHERLLQGRCIMAGSGWKVLQSDLEIQQWLFEYLCALWPQQNFANKWRCKNVSKFHVSSRAQTSTEKNIF